MSEMLILSFFFSVHCFCTKNPPLPVVLPEMSFSEGANKRKHSMISKKSKYAEVDSSEDEDHDSDNECQCSTKNIHTAHAHQSTTKPVTSSMLSPLLTEYILTCSNP